MMMWLLQSLVSVEHECGSKSLCVRDPTASVQEEVPDACCLDPGDVGDGAGEDAGFVLHGAADGAEAHHAVHLPAVLAQLAQQRTTRVSLERKKQEGGE